MMEYAKRRKKLMQKIGAKGIAILPSAYEMLRNGDAYFPFRQNSDFYYLTGFIEPEAMLVIAPKRKAGEYILFNRIRDRDKELWDGPRAGLEGAQKEFLADEAFPISELDKALPELITGREAIYYPIGLNQAFDEFIFKCVNKIRSKKRSGIEPPIEFIDIGPSLHEMRLFKSKSEIAVMQKAVDISAKAHVRAMQVCKPGMYEHELEAELMYEFIRHGARTPAYQSIVGSGKNSCVLHYVNNDHQIAEGDLILIDAGAEYQNYASDITRTFPANGRFTTEQCTIYEIVLAAQKAAIDAIKPGVSWVKMQDVILKTITEGLVEVGILKGSVSGLIEKQAYFPFYMHKSGHWLGLDVHDVGSYRVQDKWRTLAPDMVLTVEPGIYISADIPGVHKRWHNIGIRIEDDVLVTTNGREVLSRHIPKTVAQIEAIMAEEHETV